MPEVAQEPFDTVRAQRGHDTADDVDQQADHRFSFLQFAGSSRPEMSFWRVLARDNALSVRNLFRTGIALAFPRRVR